VAIVGLALRTLGRYLLPLALLSAIVLSPIIWTMLRVPLPPHTAGARSLLVLAWVLAGSAFAFQLVLVAAAAPLARSLAAGRPLSQPDALVAGLVQLVRMLLPCALALVAIALGGLALVVPGLVLLVLLSLTGASTACGLPAPLVDSIAVARANLRAVVLAVAAIVVVDLAIALLAQLVLAAPIVKKMKPPQLATYRDLVRTVGIGVTLVSPLAACVLAAIHARRAPSQ
jgi:hypothetical protein